MTNPNWMKELKKDYIVSFAKEELSIVELAELIKKLTEIFNEKSKETAIVELYGKAMKLKPKLVVELEFEKVLKLMER